MRFPAEELESWDCKWRSDLADTRTAVASTSLEAPPLVVTRSVCCCCCCCGGLLAAVRAARLAWLTLIGKVKDTPLLKLKVPPGFNMAWLEQSWAPEPEGSGTAIDEELACSMLLKEILCCWALLCWLWWWGLEAEVWWRWLLPDLSEEKIH